MKKTAGGVVGRVWEYGVAGGGRRRGWGGLFGGVICERANGGRKAGACLEWWFVGGRTMVGRRGLLWWGGLWEVIQW